MLTMKVLRVASKTYPQLSPKVIPRLNRYISLCTFDLPALFEDPDLLLWLAPIEGAVNEQPGCHFV